MNEKTYFGKDAFSHLAQLLKNTFAKLGHTHTKKDITDYADYELPTASSDTLGGVKVGAGLAINGGVLSATGGGTADSVDWSNVQNKPTNVSAFTNDAGYLTAVPSEYITETELDTAINSKISSVMTYKGTVANYTDLPSNASVGDTYNITNKSDNNKAGDNAVWNGTSWDVLSGTIDLSSYVQSSDLTEISNSEIETIWNE